MGNEISSEGQNKKNETYQECYMGYCYNVLKYRGMKSEGSEKQSNNSSEKEKLSERTTETTENVSTKIPIVFEWNEGGNNVVITGSFVNWAQFYSMTKNENGVHQLAIPLDAGVYQFKFIIDDQWRCSNAYPMVNDGNYNTNNVIDTAKCITAPNKEQASPNQVNAESQRRMNKTKDGYSCIIPRLSELNTESPAVPFHYIQSFDIDHNTKQYSIGRKKYLNYNERDLLSENNSYKKLLIVPHVNL